MVPIGSIGSGPIEIRASTYDPLALFLWVRSTNPMSRPDSFSSIVDALESKIIEPEKLGWRNMDLSTACK